MAPKNFNHPKVPMVSVRPKAVLAAILSITCVIVVGS